MTSKWDIRFLEMARFVSTWSKDPSTKCGAVIVRPDKTVASIGYNGFARQMPDKPEWYADREEKYSRVIHCEVNALIHAVEPVRGYSLYTYPFACCDRCIVQMIQSSLSKFVFPSPTKELLSRWEKSLDKTKQYMIECGVEFLEVPCEELIRAY